MNKNNDINTLKKIFKNRRYNKIFLITGKNSFIKAGASRIISGNIKNKIKFYYKKKFNSRT